MMYIPGVVGLSDQVTTYQAVPLNTSANANTSNQGSGPTAVTGASGIRRISYWVVGQGEQAGGLARWETTAVSTPDAINPQSLPSDPEEWIIAREVKSMKISYSDGSNGYWTDNWDSRAVSYDSSTPQGPPRAIKIELEMLGADGKTIRNYSQVVAIPVGNTVPLLETVGSGN